MLKKLFFSLAILISAASANAADINLSSDVELNKVSDMLIGTFGATFGTSRSYHSAGSIPRTSGVTVADSIAAKSSTVFVLPTAATSVVTITTTSNPTAVFEV